MSNPDRAVVGRTFDIPVVDKAPRADRKAVAGVGVADLEDRARHRLAFITQPWPHKAEGAAAMKIYVSQGPVACTASLVMAYAVPLRQLRIFGRPAEKD